MKKSLTEIGRQIRGKIGFCKIRESPFNFIPRSFPIAYEERSAIFVLAGGCQCLINVFFGILT